MLHSRCILKMKRLVTLKYKKRKTSQAKWCHNRSFLFCGGESEATQKLFVSLPKNLPYPGRRELAQKIGNLDRTESCMLKTETE